MNTKKWFYSLGFASLSVFGSLVAAEGDRAIPAKVEFKSELLHEGDVVSSTSSSQTVMDIQAMVGGRTVQTIHQELEERRTKSVKILAVSDEEVTGIEVRYGKVTSRVDNSVTGDMSPPSPLSEQTFRISTLDDQVSVTGVDGEKVADDVAKLVREDLDPGAGGLGLRAHPISQFLLEPVQVGDRIEVPLESIGAIVNEKSEMEAASLELVLKETREVEGRQCAVFDVGLMIKTIVDGALDTKAETRGTLVVGLADSRVYELSLAGPLTFTGSQAQGNVKIDLAGKGDLKRVENRTYATDET